MVRIPLFLIRTLVPVLFLAASCSVLEDRDPCPCRLNLVLTGRVGMDGGQDRLVLSLMDADRSLLLRESPALEAFSGGTPYRMDVPKKEFISVNGVLGLNRALQDGGIIRIPEGYAADSLWVFIAETDTRRESVTLPVRLRKEYAGIEIAFAEALDHPDEDFPFFLRLKGEACGLDLLDGSPVSGPFSCRPQERAHGVFQSTLPRQKADGSLTVELWSKDSGKAEDGMPEQQIPLDAYIAETRGFSWLDPDLKDLRIVIDYAQAQIRIAVLDWDHSTEIYLFSI